MECELCYERYDAETLPKVMKSCPHTYCQKCLLGIKEREGRVMCPVCEQTADIQNMATNESLLKAIHFK